MKSLNNCLEYLDKELYGRFPTKNTIKAKEFTHMLINHLALKNREKVTELLNKIILLSIQEDNLLVHRGLMNILASEFPEEILSFHKTEQARKFIED